MRFVLHQVLILITCSFCLATAHAQSRGERAAKVLTAPVTFEYEQSVIEIVGTAEAKRSVTLYPATGDKVIAVNFQPGQRVEKGSVLVQLDDRRQRVAVDRAKIQLEDAKRDLTRLLESNRRGAVTQAQIDEATTLRDLAQVALRDAKTDLEDKFVKAPFTGIVGLTDVEVGDRINQQTAVTTIDDRSQLFVNFNAPENALSALTSSTQVSLQPWTKRTKYIRADIAQIDSRIAEQDRTIRARALLDNTNDSYRPGMSFRVSIKTQGERFVAIPESSLSWGVGGAFVWQSVDEKAVKVSVQVKQRLHGRILVNGDFFENDELIVKGIQRLREGQAVTPEPVAYTQVKHQ